MKHCSMWSKQFWEMTFWFMEHSCWRSSRTICVMRRGIRTVFIPGLHLTPSTTAWIAFTPSHEKNGCMRVIPGSHKLGPMDHENVADDPNMLNRRGERIKIEVNESEAVDVVLEPGGDFVTREHSRSWVNPNTSDEGRIGFIVRFVTSRMRNPNTRLMRVRGDGDCGHLDLAEKPLLGPEEALAAWLAFSCA